VSESEAAAQAVVLRYRAKNDAYLMGVPARDLTDEDVAGLVGGRLGTTKPTVVKGLVASGLYTEAASEPAARHKADKES